MGAARDASAGPLKHGLYQHREAASSIITRGGEWSVQRAEPEPPKHVEDVGVNDDRPRIVEALLQTRR